MAVMIDPFSSAAGPGPEPGCGGHDDLGQGFLVEAGVAQGRLKGHGEARRVQHAGGRALHDVLQLFVEHRLGVLRVAAADLRGFLVQRARGNPVHRYLAIQGVHLEPAWPVVSGAVSQPCQREDLPDEPGEVFQLTWRHAAIMRRLRRAGREPGAALSPAGAVG